MHSNAGSLSDKQIVLCFEMEINIQGSANVNCMSSHETHSNKQQVNGHGVWSGNYLMLFVYQVFLPAHMTQCMSGSCSFVRISLLVHGT